MRTLDISSRCLTHSILIYGGFGHRPPHVRSWILFGVYLEFLDLYVSLCACHGKAIVIGLLFLHLAITSVLPYYDSVYSHPKPSYPKNRLSFAKFNGSTVGDFWKARRPVLPVARRYYRCLESSPPRNSSTATATVDTRYPVLPVSPGGPTAGRQ